MSVVTLPGIILLLHGCALERVSGKVDECSTASRMEGVDGDPEVTESLIQVDYAVGDIAHLDGQSPVESSSLASLSSFRQNCSSPGRKYGLSSGSVSDANFVPRCSEGDCALVIPNVTMKDEDSVDGFVPMWTSDPLNWVSSRFTFGELPKVVPAGRLTGRNYTNPSIIALPQSLRSHYPNGAWLYTHCSFINRQRRIFVLGPDFETITDAKVDVHDDEGKVGPNGSGLTSGAISDARLLDLDAGESVLMSFSAYALKLTQYALERDWWNHDGQLVTKLRFRVSPAGEAGGAPTLEAWMQINETRVFVECPEKGYSAPGPKKNFGLFRHFNGGVYAIDWIYPTQIGEVHVGGIQAADASSSLYITPMCFGVAKQPHLLTALPWAGSVSFGCGGLHAGELHNGPNPIWIDETKEYLGIAHFVRGCSHYPDTYTCQEDYPKFGHHYTHIFFTFSPHMPFQLLRIGSSEFCFADGLTHDETDCDIVQFISGLARDGETLRIGYGAQDRHSFVGSLLVRDVLASLRELH